MPTVTIDVYPTQEQFIWDHHHFTAFIGGRGAGKTVSGAIKAMPYLTKPGMGIVAAPTYTMLRDAPWRTALEIWAPLIKDINRADMRIVTHAGHEVLFRSADDPNKLRGPSASWAWIDEACMCPEQTWPILLGVLREGGRMGQCWVTSTPRGYDWVYETFGTGAPDTALYKARMDGNPFLDDAFKHAMRTQYASEFARQELDAEFITLGAGLIKRSWFDVVPQAPAVLRWQRFWDLAASTKTGSDSTASVRAAMHGDDIYLSNLIVGQWEWPETRRVILQTMQQEPDTVQVGIENVAFQLAAVQEIQRAPEALRTAVRGIGIDRDKLSRALPWIAKAEQGRIKLVAGSTWNDFLSQAEQFPEGKHDDMIDAVSGAFAMVGAYRPNLGIIF